MGVVVQFDYNAWIARYPEFSTVPSNTATMYFNEATLYVRNDGGGPVADSNTQLTLLNMVTAHIACMNFGVGGQAPSPLVGRVSTASEGSVSIGVTADYQPGTPQWFVSTKYGAAYWAASAQYRTMRYSRALPRHNAFPYGRPDLYGWGS